jgi:hypothetical protein
VLVLRHSLAVRPASPTLLRFSSRPRTPLVQNDLRLAHAHLHPLGLHPPPPLNPVHADHQGYIPIRHPRPPCPPRPLGILHVCSRRQVCRWRSGSGARAYAIAALDLARPSISDTPSTRTWPTHCQSPCHLCVFVPAHKDSTAASRATTRM